MKFLPETTQTTYSTLLQKLEDSRLALLTNVGFSQKKVKDGTYWYCQYTDISGVRKQRYIGPDTPETKALIDRVTLSSNTNKEIMAARKRLVAMTIAGGANMEKGRSAKIIERMADAGVFDAGGMLIGSYAFSCYGNLLGVMFDESMRRTEDMDVAYDRSIEIGFVRDVRSDIMDASQEMSEPPQINPWVPPYEMIAPDGFKLEFLTSKTGPQDKAPVPVERFSVNALPLEFLDYLIEKPVKAVVLYGAGILVNVPDPARFAIHKLAVSQLRQTVKPEKSRKDLQQASALIEYYLEENPGALMLAAEAAKARNDKLVSLIEQGVRVLKDHELEEHFMEECWAQA